MTRTRTVGLLLCLLVLAGCSGTATTYEKYLGNDGLLIRFLDNQPPETVYEDRPFPVRVEVHNAGAENVSYDRMIILFSKDPLYITGGIGNYSPKKYDLSAKEILGRSVIYPKGEKKVYGIPTDASFTTKPVFGQRESPETTMVATLCYPYRTYLSTEVCIDTNIYQENLRAQPCKEKDLTFSGGQGAPIAITQVEVMALPVISESGTESIRPQFIIHLKNVGKGQLLGPDSLNLERACVFQEIPKEQVNTVRVSATLLKSRLMCGQAKNKSVEGLVRLELGEGEITCTVADDELNNPLYSSTQNFQSILTVNVSYLYKASAEKTIKIERILGSPDRIPTGSENGKVSGYAYEGDAIVRDIAGDPVTLCEYYGSDVSKVPSDPRLDVLRKRIPALAPKNLTCACDYDRCLEIGRGVNCFDGLCPGATFCCTDPPKPTLVASMGGGADVPIEPDASIVIPSVGAKPSKQQINDALEAAARQYGIPADVLKAVAYQESKWNPSAVGDGGKSYGIMQIHTRWHPNYDVAKGKADVSYNIQYGAQLLAWCKTQAKDGSWYSATRVYNGGPTYYARPKAAANTQLYADQVAGHIKSTPWTQFRVTEGGAATTPGAPPADSATS